LTKLPSWIWDDAKSLLAGWMMQRTGCVPVTKVAIEQRGVCDHLYYTKPDTDLAKDIALYNYEGYAMSNALAAVKGHYDKKHGVWVP
jgi:hypothetical protein